jgi:hypothetical protein
MHRIDHVCIGARNPYEAADRLRAETGLVAYDGGWNPSMGMAQRIVPLGRRTYLEINSIIDRDLGANHFYGGWYLATLDDAGGADRFMGWVIAVDTMDELHAIADRIGLEIGAEGKWENGREMTWKRRLPSGHSHRNENVPDDRHHAWPRGLPMFMHWPGEAQGDHPDSIAEARAVVQPSHPDGIAWVEVGGEGAVREWLGPALADMDVRFVDEPAGLYAVGIRTADTELVIRRPPVPLSMARYYTP